MRWAIFEIWLIHCDISGRAWQHMPARRSRAGWFCECVLVEASIAEILVQGVFQFEALSMKLFSRSSRLPSCFPDLEEVKRRIEP